MVRRDLVEQPALILLIEELRQRLNAASRSPTLAEGGLICLN